MPTSLRFDGAVLSPFWELCAGWTVVDNGSTSAGRTPPLERVATFAGTKQQAFVPYVFAGAAHPLHMQTAYKSYWRFAPYPENARDMARYDHVLAIRHP
jgi:hypothetical protein